jgi:hypothetical protein
MLERLFLSHATALVTIAAFAVASSIFIAVAWRALRMRPHQLDRFSHLPFETPTPASHHEPKSESAAD